MLEILDPGDCSTAQKDSQVNIVQCRQNKRTSDLKKIVAQQASSITAITATVETLSAEFKKHKDEIIDLVLEHIRVNGLRLGNRWKIQEEGTNSYEALVFRDLTSSNRGLDRRYAMFKERYTDL